MKRTGKAHVYGDRINTDLIIAGKYTKTLNMQDLADHCLEDLDPDFTKNVEQGDFVVAGENFGCGSSREQAPLAIKYSGVSAVLAKSFARIFYRNAINVGIPVIICDTSKIQKGDKIVVDQEQGRILINDKTQITYQRRPKIMQDILDKGGLVSFLKEKGDFVL